MKGPNIFIQVAPDCPAPRGVIPESKREPKPIHVIQFELLAESPYRYSHDELIFEVHIRQMGISEAERRLNGDEIRRSLARKTHPCLRTCVLAKKYGWGIHVNTEGKVALWGRESDEYRRFTQSQDGSLTLTTALRNRRR